MSVIAVDGASVRRKTDVVARDYVARRPRMRCQLSRRAVLDALVALPAAVRRRRRLRRRFRRSLGVDHRRL